VGPRDVLEAVVKRKTPSPCWKSNPRTPIVQPVAHDINVFLMPRINLDVDKKPTIKF
jgi:hypothetical protein